jgi:hypothetical protein
MKREAHFKDLAQCCACHSCYVKRRVTRVTNKLRGIKQEPAFQFGFRGWKNYPQIDTPNPYLYIGDIIVAKPRLLFKLEGV